MAVTPLKRNVNIENVCGVVFDTVLDAIIVIDSSGFIHLFNPAAEKIFGYSPEEVIGKNVSILMPEPYASAHGSYIHHYQSTGEKKIIGIGREIVGRRKDGSVFPMELAVSEMIVDGNQMFTGVARDLTETKQVTKSLNQLKTTLDLTNDGLFIFHPDTLKFLYINRGATKQVGYSEKELLAMTPLNIKTEFTEVRFRAMLDSLIDSETHTMNIETVHQHKDGSLIPVEVTLQYMAPEGESPRFSAISRDISERKQSEQALQESQEKLQGLYELSPLGIALTDMEGHYLEFNRAFQKICGYSEDELKKLDYWELTPKEYEKAEIEQLQALGDTGFYGPYEKVYRQKNGNLIPIRLNGILVKDKVGNPRIWSIVEDISEHRRVELAQKQLIRRHRLALDSAELGAWDWDIESNTLTWDERMYKLYGMQPKEFSSNYEAWLSTVYPEDQAHCQAAIDTALHNEVEYDIEFRIRWRDGRIRWIKGDGLVIRDFDGRPIRMIGINRDITRRKNMEEKLEKQKQLLDMLHQTTTSFVAKGDFSEAMNEMLDTLLQITDSKYGFTGEVLHDDESKPYLKTHAITNIAWNEETQKLYQENVAKGFEFRNLDTLFGHALTSGQPVMSNDPATDPRAGGLPAGHPAMDSFLGVPIFYGDDLVGMYGIANRPDGYDEAIQQFLQPFNVTYGVMICSKRLMMQEEENRTALVEAKDSAEQANQAKSQFLSSMSHELRTPLNAVIGYSELLKEEAEELGQDAFVPDLQRIQTAGRHLLDLITDILDLSKIEAGKIELDIEPVDISLLVSDIITTVQPLIEKNGNRLLKDIDDGLGEMQTDQTRLTQVLYNLLSNAAKFTQDGEITLEIKRETINEKEYMLFQVRDTGIGMSEEQQARVFDTFTQAEASTTTQYGGTGLGLSISRQLCQLMGGSLEGQSEPGIGSLFTVSLPVSIEASD